ncbi:hypothetical protein DPEC_G00240100 [Dallia pectoralis]|uniref:Uncharacterized protein n=1 Tax=Dallia pectoralis TaxID=75939 RepID=A0ACC2FZA4_DALPE|nr:hypothetical protein DPEC_G00240100 [Dallia pectoralis]
MDTITRKIKKHNKENAKPCSGPSKSLRAVPTKTLAAPSSRKRVDLGKDGASEGKTERKDVKVPVADDLKRRHTLSQAFLTKQAERQKKQVADTTKRPATVPTKPVPGTYKGKVVQSKISSFRKPGGLEGASKATKTSVPKAESQNPGNASTVRSKSVSDMPVRGLFKTAQSSQPSRSKSVSDGPPPVSRCLVPSSGRPTGSRSAVPPARTVLFTAACPSSTTSAVRSKVNKPQSTKLTKTVAMDKKVHKPPCFSSLSQYRAHTDTAEERRAKLADWLASKGKILKRPPISASAPRSKQVLKPEPKIRPEVIQQETIIADPEPVSQPENSPVFSEPKTCTLTPMIMNTTLDLIDNSDTDCLPVDPEISMNDVVVNLCEALEAMTTPSACLNEEPQEKSYKCEEKMESTPNNDLDKDSEVGGEAAEQKTRKCHFKEVDGDYGLVERTAEVEGASMVKYSVKTTPYLQSVKRTIDGGACGSGSRRKGTIKDLKFLTPVRRSSRIQRNSCRLPGMLADHDTCVSSLAELVNMDDDANAYIFRRNPAILSDLPDHHKDLERI